MKQLTVQEIRELWIEFFKSKEHYILESKSIVPVDDNSILFINSGVATLKKYFDGSENPPASRLANVQKALRTNDIENVGVTSRHQTLFEMLGNFSIGDYFKNEAIDYAFEFLTDSKWCDIDINKLYFTVHPEDTVAYDKWIKLGVDAERIVKLEENFWEIGSGPGGPNSEIFFDRGIEYDSRDVIKLLEQDLENDRIIEIWNLVFSEFNCEPLSKKRHEYECLPQQNIDTGMGLERMACIMQDVNSNFETDEFSAIIKNIEQISGLQYKQNIKAFRIVADHIRALTFAISDGALPSNDGRGYVLRRILRRAVRYGYIELNINEAFLYKVVDQVVDVMGAFYSELYEQKNYISQIIKEEEEKFLKTIENGLNMFNKELEKNRSIISGDVAFLLYDTFGFPIEITTELAQNNNIKVDIETFELKLEQQRERARQAMNDTVAMSRQNPFLKEITVDSKFIGYESLKSESKIVMITDLHQSFKQINNGEIYVILDETPFYATSGGQVADRGEINSNSVIDVIKLPNGQFAHLIIVTNPIKVNEIVSCIVDEERRNKISANHSATHLLHDALHKIVSPNAKQAGSYQDEHRTRFDFSSLHPLTNEQINEIEKNVNNEINNSNVVNIEHMSLDEAKEKNITALFGEKYGDIVRVVQMGDSIELCGGTHVKSTSEIKYFHILSESGIGSGVRRIEAITNSNVILYHEELKENIDNFIRESYDKFCENVLISTTSLNKLKSDALSLVGTIDDGLSKSIDKLDKLLLDNEALKKQNEAKNSSLAKDIVSNLLTKITVSDDVNRINEFVNEVDVKKLREISDEILNRVENCIVILKQQNENKVSVIVGVSKNLSTSYNANVIIKEVVEPFNGKGGGKPTFAQGGYQI